MTCVHETTAHSARAEETDYKILLRKIKEEFPDAAIKCDEVDKAAHKLQPSFQRKDEDGDRWIPVLDKDTDYPMDIMDISIVLEGIMKPINIKRIYIEKSVAVEAKSFVRSEKSF